MKRDPRIDAVAAGDLSSAAILAALIGMLGAKGLLSEEVREVYEQALYLLEAHQAEAEPEMRPIFEAAREGYRGAATAERGYRDEGERIAKMQHSGCLFCESPMHKSY